MERVAVIHHFLFTVNMSESLTSARFGGLLYGKGEKTKQNQKNDVQG